MSEQISQRGILNVSQISHRGILFYTVLKHIGYVPEFLYNVICDIFSLQTLISIV